MAGKTAIGLDIGTSVVRAVELSYGRGGITLERFGQVVLPEGARIWVCVPDAGYVAVGTTLLPATRFEAAEVLLDGTWIPLAGQQLAGIYRQDEDSDDDNAEWVVPVVWSDSRPLSEAFWQKGMFASTHSACKLRQEFTLGLLETHFDVGDD